MSDTLMNTYRVGIIERALAYYKVEAEDPRTAAENWSDGEFEDRDDEALDCEGPCNVRERQQDGTWREVPRAEWEEERPVSSGLGKPFSVLLLYPDYAKDSGTETYYGFVVAADAMNAVTAARAQAVAAQTGVDIEPDDFAPLLVTEGHHHGEALFDK